MGRYRKAPKYYDYGYLKGTCNRCGETWDNLIWYERTKEKLCQLCLQVRLDGESGKLKVKKEIEEDETFRYLTSLPND